MAWAEAQLLARRLTPRQCDGPLPHIQRSDPEADDSQPRFYRCKVLLDGI